MAEYKVITEEEAKQFGFGKFPITVIPHLLVEMRDRVSLAMKLWLPATSVDGTSLAGLESYTLYQPSDGILDTLPQPAILEYLPYCKSDGTLQRDHQRNTYLASHGYCVARVDLRGSGDSEGTYHGEYLPQELSDGYDVIAWLAAQPWCNGNVGIHGISWGGFNALQIAYKQPAALKAVISMASSENRYLHDIHYEGGSILASQALEWSAFMFSMNAAPPHPYHVDNWHSLWQERLEKASEPWIHDWLSHQLLDDFWRQGSVGEDPSRVTCPTLIIGGWNDGYRDSMLEALKTFPNVRGILRPWAHLWPDLGIPGPRLSIAECLKWWDCHLKGIDNGAMDTPLLRVFMQDAFIPENDVQSIRNGEWIGVDTWPPAECQWISFLPDNSTTFLIDDDGQKLKLSVAEISFSESFKHGSCFGDYFHVPCSYFNRFPGDQNPDDIHSLCWTSSVLDREIRILGRPQVFISVAITNSNEGNLIVRLCDVFPDGKSTLITYGVLNLAHRDGHTAETVSAMVQGEIYKVHVECKCVGYVIPKGHSLRLAVAPNYWPHIWPPKDPVTYKVITGSISKLSMVDEERNLTTKLLLPTLQSRLLYTGFCSTPTNHPHTPFEVIKEFEGNSYSEFDEKNQVYKYVKMCNEGKIYFKQIGTVVGSKMETKFTMQGNDPLSACIEVDCLMEYEYPDIDGGINVSISTFSKLSCDHEVFYLFHKMNVLMNGERFFFKEWYKDIPRVHV